jgi:regulator of protease activity HflC (stomatin/prohibitin superfamily)
VDRYAGLLGWSPKYCCPSVLSALLYLPCLPFFVCGSCIKVSENQEAVVKSWGRYLGKIQHPGCYFLNPIGSQVVVIDTRQQVLDIATVKVADHAGNPLVISGIVTYYIGESEKVVLNIEDIKGFMETQSQSVIKQVVSKYPYESVDNKTSLKSSHDLIAEEMRVELQKKVDISGAVVVSFELTDLSYAPEIANAMLVRQQAEATVSARNTIVKGAVMITNGAVESIEARGIKFSREEKAKLMGNLLITICGETRVQPVMKLDMPDFGGK